MSVLNFDEEWTELEVADFLKEGIPDEYADVFLFKFKCYSICCTPASRGMSVFSSSYLK